MLKNKALTIIFTCVFLELFLGGTGRLIELTSFLTLRMCFFLVYIMLIGYFLLAKHKLSWEIVFIISFFLLLCVFDGLIGYLNNAALADIFEDIKPLINIFLLCYLYFSIKTTDDIQYLIKLIKISTVLLVILHFALYSVVLVFSNFALLYSSVNNTQGDNLVFIFKGDTGLVNYTGDLYLCVGFIVWDQYHKRSKLKTFMLICIAISIILTGTRGLIFALAGTYLVKWIFLKLQYRSLVYLFLGMIVLGGIIFSLSDKIGDKDESDQIRYETIHQVIDNINPASLLVGHGFGIGVPIRPTHMEISYLEVFHKQGVLGLLYYTAIFLIAYILYKSNDQRNSMGFFMSLIFVYLLSFTNPYLNHPLGITIISIAIVCMKKMSLVEDKQVLLIR